MEISGTGYDLLIQNGKVIDGSGNPWFYGDVAVRGDRIIAIAPRGRIDATNAREIVDASSHVVAPGFIDIQSHSIIPFFSDGRCLSKITQGVTTEIMGEAWTPSPFGGRIADPLRSSLIAVEVEGWQEEARTWTRFRPWLEAMERRGVSPNIGSFVGGATIREYARGWDMGEPTPDEVATMCRVMDECMQDGAFGIATALIYPPGSYAGTEEELVEIAKVIGRYGGVYITHIRSEGELILHGMAEAIEIGRRGLCAVEIYHLKASGKSSWKLMPRAMDLIEEARAEGVNITADMYPYVASGTGLTTLVPTWASEGGKLFENLADATTWAALRAEMIDPPMEAPGMARSENLDGVMPVGFIKDENRQYIGKRLPEIAEMRGQAWPDTVRELLLSEHHRISTIFFMMSEDNVRDQLRKPWVKVSTDAGGLDPQGQTNPTHPRAYGTFPRVLGKYVREEGIITLEDAVRKMTSSVADRLSLRDRGLLREGLAADIIVFDPATVADRATFTDPHQLSVGIRDVWVNGGRVLADGAHTGAMPGRVVDGPGR